jgi:monofunctional biosynthetic peptidoglycan transglycosylase
VSAAALSAYQAARLAAMAPKPRYYDKRRSTPWLERKTAIIQARMDAARIP